MDLFIAGTAIGLSEPIISHHVTAEKFREVNAVIGEHLIASDVVVVTKATFGWHWRRWECPTNPDMWLMVGVSSRCSSAARAAAF